ncbi:MAG: magnesium/cobalt transporter CorA [bacterium]
MRGFIKKRSKKKGLAPGTLVYVGEQKTDRVRISLIDYNETEFQEKEVKKIEECFPFKDKPSVTWINIDGLHDIDLIEKIGKHFGLHPLILEDILNTEQRPKIEDFEKYMFIVLKMIYYNEKENETKAEQVSLILGTNFVISFQEKPGDVFDPLRERIKKAKGRIRKAEADYLLYSLLDSIIDSYFSVLEKFGDRIENLEEMVVTEPKPGSLKAIHELKREMIYLRKSVWPLREVINNFGKAESPLVHKSTNIYLRDIYDHTIQIIDTIETFRDMLSGMHDTYLSSISNRMNEIMKVLTIFAAIFIPLTFIAGVYGMNFQFMPELSWRWGYFGVWGVILAVGLSMLFYFKRKKWL